MHNNDISIILGKKWNSESEDVKDEYRARAEKIKQKHAIENPGYQYAPRKSSEKKRRMTAKKLAQLRAAASEEDQDLAMPTTTPVDSAAQTVGVVRDNSPGNISRFTEDAPEISFNLPIPQIPMQQQLNINQRTVPQQALLSFDDELQQSHITASTTPANWNEQEFLNGLIDWEGLRRDSDLLFTMNGQEVDGVASAETGLHQEEEELTEEELNAELDRLIRWI